MSLLQVNRLTRRFGGLLAVNDVSFTVNQGEIVGLIGPNGAGKTTIFAMLAGFLVPTAGQILLDGQRIDGKKPHAICKLGVARTFQIVQPFPQMTVLENVMVGAYAKISDTAHARQKALAVLERAGLARRAQTLGRDLTLLDLKRLEIGKALATDPRLLLLDEVAAGLKPTEVDVVLELVRQLNHEGVTFLIVEHLMKVIMSLSQRIVVLDFGQKIAEDTPEAIQRDPKVLAAYLGEEE